MKVREFNVMIPMHVQLCEQVEAEEGKFDSRDINNPCYIDELPEELQNREVMFLYPKSGNIMGIFLTDDAEPELPFSDDEEVE